MTLAAPPLPPRTADFVKRLRSMPGRVLRVLVVVDSKGEPVFWQVEDEGKAEGLRADEKEPP
jgi:hypothetical protein